MGLLRRSARIYAENRKGSIESSMADEWAEHEGEARMFAELRKRQRLLPPLGSSHGRWRRNWLFLLLLCAVMEALYLPYAVAFRYPRNAAGDLELPLWAAVSQWAADLLCLAEVVLMFRTTLQEPMYKGGGIVTDKAVISRSYRHSGRFFVDVVAILPLEFFALLLESPTPGGDRDALAALCSSRAVLLRLNRILHAYRVFVYHGRSILTLSRPKRSVVSWGLFLILAHWVACAWWAIGSENFKTLRTPIDASSSYSQQYFTSLYWSLTTLLKVPFVPPSTGIEQLFTNLVMLIGAVAFAFFNAEVHAIVQTNLGTFLARTKHINNLRTLFHKASHGGLAQRTALKWSAASAKAARLKGDNVKEQQIIKMLPNSLRAELWRAMYKELTTPDCGLEGRISHGAMAQIAAACWPAVFLPRQVLVAAYAVTSELFILQRGSLRLSGGVAMGANKPGVGGSGMGAGGRVDRWMRQGNGDRTSFAAGGRTSRALGSMTGGSKKRASRFSVSQQSTKNASAFSLPVQLPGAENSRFRILEREGAMVGNYQAYRSPFIVEAIKLSQVLVLDAGEVLGQMSETDAAAVKSAIKSQLEISIENLTGARRKATFRPSGRGSVVSSAWDRESEADPPATDNEAFIDGWSASTQQSPARRFLQGAPSHRKLRVAQAKLWKESTTNRRGSVAAASTSTSENLEAKEQIEQISRLQRVFDSEEATYLEDTIVSCRQGLRSLRESSQANFAELKMLSERLRERKGKKPSSCSTSSSNMSMDASFDKGSPIEEMVLEE